MLIQRAEIFFFFGTAPQHVGSQLPNQGSNPHPLHWRGGVLTTGLPGEVPVGKDLFNKYVFKAERGTVVELSPVQPPDRFGRVQSPPALQKNKYRQARVGAVKTEAPASFQRWPSAASVS